MPYAEVYDDSFRLLGGQTWIQLTSMPHTVNYSVGWGVGNIGFRRMQLRYERYLAFNDVFMVTPAVAACQNVVVGWSERGSRAHRLAGDGRTPRIHVGRARRRLQARDVWHIRPHWEQGFDFPAVGPIPVALDVRVRTWSFNTDVAIPITDRLSFQGEFFTGADLNIHGAAFYKVWISPGEAIVLDRWLV